MWKLNRIQLRSSTLKRLLWCVMYNFNDYSISVISSWSFWHLHHDLKYGEDNESSSSSSQKLGSDKSRRTIICPVFHVKYRWWVRYVGTIISFLGPESKSYIWITKWIIDTLKSFIGVWVKEVNIQLL